MEHAIKLAILVLTSTSAFASIPQKLVLDPGQSTVHFTALGRPSLLRIKGENAHAKGELTSKGADYSGEISVDLNEFKTGIALRDRHMKEKYLELNKPENAQAKLNISKLSVECVNEAKTEKECPFTGTLSLHGKTQVIEGKAAISDIAGMKNIVTRWSIKLTDFGINVPEFAGVTVADEVQISAEVKAKGESL